MHLSIRLARHNPLATLILLAAAIIPTCLSAEVRYTLTDLGTLGGTSSEARAINADGVVVGSSTTESINEAHFIYKNGTMEKLPWVGWFGTYAFGINDTGHVVGSTGSWGISHPIAYLLTENQTNTFGFEGTMWSTAYAINNEDAVVGASFIENNQGPHAFRYSSGVITDLGTLGGASYATAINDVGQVVGYCETPNGNRAFLYQEGSMNDIGTIAGGHTKAYGINSAGQVVGSSQVPDQETNAFLYTQGAMKSLGALGTSGACAYDINNNGEVVGFIYATPYGHAFLYSAGFMRDLNDLIDPATGFTVCVAFAVNDHGQIVGRGINAAGQQRAFLLTPVVPPVVEERPILSCRPAAAGLTVSWPMEAVGFTLYHSSSLATPVWSAVTNAPQLANGKFQLTLEVANALSAQGFYRLQME